MRPRARADSRWSASVSRPFAGLRLGRQQCRWPVLDHRQHLRQAMSMAFRGKGSWFVLCVVGFGLLPIRGALAWEDVRIRKNPVFPNEYIIERNGQRQGTIRPNPVFRDEWDVYDQSGQRKATVRRNPVFRDELDVYSPSGTREKTIRENPVFQGEFDVYDRTGQRTGRVRPDPVFRDEWKFERFGR
ncbi:MAG: hypothetical protein KatS3mg077_1966 [Candidatus Binatia bacterium]|nr:MAG: hypothetical protein KatS3mg077_1966 [Candidatus Binatia bacterium]